MAQRDGQTDGKRDGWTDGGTERQSDGRTDGWTDEQKISPFYSTSSHIRATALHSPMKTMEVEQGMGTADHLMPLGYFI